MMVWALDLPGTVADVLWTYLTLLFMTRMDQPDTVRALVFNETVVDEGSGFILHFF